MVIKGGNCQCKLKSAKENGKQLTVVGNKIVRTGDLRINELNSNVQNWNGIDPLAQEVIGGAKSKRAKLEKMKVPKLQKMAASKGIKITKKKDGKTVYLKKATLVNKLLRK